VEAIFYAGLGKYDNLTMQSNHPPTPLKLSDASGSFGLETKLNWRRFSFSLMGQSTGVPATGSKIDRQGRAQGAGALRGSGWVSLRFFLRKFLFQMAPRIGYTYETEEVEIVDPQNSYHELRWDHGPLLGIGTEYKFNKKTTLFFQYDYDLSKVNAHHYRFETRYLLWVDSKDRNYGPVGLGAFWTARDDGRSNMNIYILFGLGEWITR